MSANCPYCGAKLNLGLRFCVVCGRHVSTENIGKFSGLRGGFRPADITRRLDEIISVARFKKSRQSHDFQRAARWTVVNTIYLVVATGLFYSAVLYSLELMFPGKFKETQMPVETFVGLFNKHKDKLPASVAGIASGANEDKKSATKADEKPAAPAKTASKNKKASKKVRKSSKRRKKKRSRRRRRRRNVKKQ